MNQEQNTDQVNQQNPNSNPNFTIPQQRIEIEQTSKKWKILNLISFLLFIIGVFSGFVGVFTEGVNTTNEVFLCLSLTAVLHFIARVGAWWTNG